MASWAGRARLCAVLLGMVTAVAAASAAQAQMDPGNGGAGQAREVGVVAATETDVPQVVTLSGRAVAYQVAAVRPRIGGVIDAIEFKAGEHLEAGAPMFKLDIGNLDVELMAAEAAVEGARAARQSAQATVSRYTQLVGKGVSRTDLETAQVDVRRAEADLGGAEANLKAALLERERADITAPIAGVASRTPFTIGSLVTANQTEALATVTRLDPVYIDVVAPSASILIARHRIAEGVMTPHDPPEISLILEDGRRYEAEGEIVDRGTTVSTTTGTVDLRMQFPNPDRLILPGQFARIDMTLGTIRAILVPQRAASRLADGSLSVFVAEDGKAERVTLTAVGAWNNAWVVTDGLSIGDQIIIDGLSNLQDGMAVDPLPVTLDERGVVVETASAPDSVATNTEEGDQTGNARLAASGSPQPDSAARSGAAQATGWFSRLRRWIGLDVDESFERGAETRWQRLRALLGAAPRTAG